MMYVWKKVYIYICIYIYYVYVCFAQTQRIPEQLCSGKPTPFLLRKLKVGFHGGAVVKNPPANAGDMGSSPGPGRSHMPWSN